MPELQSDKLFFEKKAKASGARRVAGVDEAGRGPLAGPVVASAVVINNSDFFERIDDSKKLTDRMRKKAYIEILDKCDVGIGITSVADIDRYNIYNATLIAMKRAVLDLKEAPEYILVDGNMEIPLDNPQKSLVKGESKSLSIACASIIAKVFRDNMMIEFDKKFSSYGFKQHKGYGTKAHMEAIKKYGLSPIHRKTFGPFGTKAKK